MLQAIREKAQGWIAWAIVILITIPFALWGIQEYLGVGGEPEVAKVNGESITERVLDQRTRDFRENMRATLGDSYNASMFDDETIKPRVLQALIEERVLGDTTTDWNLRVSDAQVRGFIATIPGFQQNGRFDPLVYESAVRNRGMSRAGFEQAVRQEMTVQQLRSAVSDSTFVTESALATRIRLQDQKRDLAYVVIPASTYRDQVSVNDEALEQFYAANADRYRVHERVKLSYVLLDAAEIGKLVEVTEPALRQFFKERRGDFVAREERAMRHILLAVAAGASEEDVAAVQEKAQQLLDRIKGGEDFAVLAKEFSEDPGSAGNGGDLGWVERGMMVAPFEDAGFALKKGETSDLVRTDFGFHIVQVTDIRGGSDATFEDLRDEVDSAYRKHEGENLYFEYAERLAETAYENSDSLVPAAETLGLQVNTTDWLSRDDRREGPLGNPKVINAAFSDDVLMERHNSELIEVGPQQAVVIRVSEYEPAGTRPLAEVQQKVREDFVAEKASEAAAATGKTALQALNDGKSMADIAGENAWRMEQPGPVERASTQVPAEILARLFELAMSEGKPNHTGLVSADGDYVLIELRGVQGGSLDKLSVAERPLLAEQVSSGLGNSQMRSFIQSLRDEASVEQVSAKNE